MPGEAEAQQTKDTAGAGNGEPDGAAKVPESPAKEPADDP
jgi:hypothetical protein